MIKPAIFVLSFALHVILISLLTIPHADSNSPSKVMIQLKHATTEQKVEKEEMEVGKPMETVTKQTVKKTVIKKTVPGVNPNIENSISPEPKNNSDSLDQIENQKNVSEIDEQPLLENISDDSNTRIEQNHKESPNIDSIKHTWKNSILEKIDRAKQYPPAAKRTGKEGSVEVEFTIYRNGSVSGIRLTNSSPFTPFNDAALKAVESSQPFEPIPGELGVEQLTLSVTIEFTIL